MRSLFTSLGRSAAIAAFVLQLCSCAYSAWDRARAQESLAAYSQFIRDHPNSPHVAEAEERMAYLRVKTYRTRESFEAFEKRYPQSALHAELQGIVEPLYFEEARSAHTIAAYDAFLKKYPSGPLATRARGNRAYIADVVRQPTDEKLRSFLEAHPTSDFAAEARLTLELLDIQKKTEIRTLGVRVDVAPNVEQPTRVRVGFASMFARVYRERGVDVRMIEADAVPGPELDGWVTVDYREAPASGVLGAATQLAQCRVRVYQHDLDQPVWDRTFEAPAEHVIQGAYGRDRTIFGSSRYRFWRDFFVPVATWAVSETRVQRLDYLEDVQAIDVLGERAALLLERGGVDFLDVSSPPQVTVVDRYRRQADLATWQGVRMLRPDLTVTFGSDGVELIQKGEAAMEQIAKFDGPTVGAIHGAALFESTLLIAGNQGLYAVRLNRAPMTPQRLLDGEIIAVEQRPPYIVVVRPNRVELALPKHLLQHLTEKKISLGSFNATRSRLAGDQLFLFGNEGVLQVSLAKPGSGQIVSMIKPSDVGRLRDVAASGKQLLMLGDRGLQIANPGEAEIADAIQVRSDRSVGVHGRFALLVGNNALEVLDLSPYAMRAPKNIARAKKKAKPESVPAAADEHEVLPAKEPPVAGAQTEAEPHGAEPAHTAPQSPAPADAPAAPAKDEHGEAAPHAEQPEHH